MLFTFFIILVHNSSARKSAKKDVYIKQMKEYLLSLVTVVTVCAFLSFISEGKRQSRGVAFACALVVLYTIVAPIKGLLPTLAEEISSYENIVSDNDDYGQNTSDDGEESEGWLSGQVKESLEKSIADDISQRFNISDTDTSQTSDISVKADLTFTDDGIIIGKLHIDLRGKAVSANIPAIAAYVKKTYCAECEVTVNGK